MHKLILMARSPVFEAMLGSDMVEKSQGMIKIEVTPEKFHKHCKVLFTMESIPPNIKLKTV